MQQGGNVRRAADDADAAQLWQARRSVSPALGRIRPQRMNEDIVVPRSVLSEVVREIEALGLASGFHVVQFGHIGATATCTPTSCSIPRPNRKTAFTPWRTTSRWWRCGTAGCSAANTVSAA